MLHSMRQRMKSMAEAESRGVSFWTESFSDSVRVRVRRAYDALEYVDAGTVFANARRMILDQGGADYLVNPELSPQNDFAALFRTGPDEMFPTALEALVVSLAEWDRGMSRSWPIGYADKLADSVNEIFAQERVAWKLVDSQMVEMKSQELHESVVEPALRLIHEARFTKVDATYRKALDELSRGDGADAVTDAGTAL
jgi:hypothetical protein